MSNSKKSTAPAVSQDNILVSQDGILVNICGIIYRIIFAAIATKEAQDEGIYVNFAYEIIGSNGMRQVVSSEMTIRQNREGKVYIAGPRRQYQGRNGVTSVSLTTFMPMIDGMPHPLHDQATSAMVAAVKFFIKERNEKLEAPKQKVAVNADLKEILAIAPVEKVREAYIPKPGKREVPADDMPFA